MLPPNLRAIATTIAAKESYRRTSGEDALLQELNELDRALEVTSVKDSVKKSANFSETRYVGSGEGSCRCCGR